MVFVWVSDFTLRVRESQGDYEISPGDISPGLIS